MDKIEAQHLETEFQIGMEPESLGLTHNYTVLLSKLEKLAALGDSKNELLGRTIPAAEPGHHVMSEAEYSRVISDIWIGIVLTLLIISIVFFICSCFLYHKFQKWKHSYQTHSPEQPELSRRYDMDLESVSLPSYTICSGLPTYDDALDQFRKHGIYIQQPSVVKLFEENNTTKTAVEINDDNISMNSTCTCGGNSAPATALPKPVLTPNYIELNPDQLQMLSQQRLSLQIALNSSIRRSNRNGRIDLCRQVNRSNLLRSHEIPQIHRSASQQSLCHDHLLSPRLKNAQHRGSLC